MTGTGTAGRKLIVSLGITAFTIYDTAKIFSVKSNFPPNILIYNYNDVVYEYMISKFLIDFRSAWENGKKFDEKS